MSRDVFCGGAILIWSLGRMSTTHLLPDSKPRKGRHRTITRMADPRPLSSSSDSPCANPSWVWAARTVDAGVAGAVSAVMAVPAGDSGGGRGGLTVVGLLGGAVCTSVVPALGGIAVSVVAQISVDFFSVNVYLM